MGNPAPSLKQLISDMDEDVSAAGGFAEIVTALGTTSCAIDPDGLFVLGRAMDSWAARLKERWQAAFEASRDAR